MNKAQSYKGTTARANVLRASKLSAPSESNSANDLKAKKTSKEVEIV